MPVRRRPRPGGRGALRAARGAALALGGRGGRRMRVGMPPAPAAPAPVRWARIIRGLNVRLWPPAGLTRPQACAQWAGCAAAEGPAGRARTPPPPSHRGDGGLPRRLRARHGVRHGLRRPDGRGGAVRQRAPRHVHPELGRRRPPGGVQIQCDGCAAPEGRPRPPPPPRRRPAWRSSRSPALPCRRPRPSRRPRRPTPRPVAAPRRGAPLGQLRPTARPAQRCRARPPAQGGRRSTPRRRRRTRPPSPCRTASGGTCRSPCRPPSRSGTRRSRRAARAPYPCRRRRTRPRSGTPPPPLQPATAGLPPPS